MTDSDLVKCWDRRRFLYHCNWFLNLWLSVFGWSKQNTWI